MRPDPEEPMSLTRLIVVAFALVGFGAQTAPRFMTARDTLSFVGVGAPAISPDDQWVLYTRTVRDFDDAQWRQRTHIWRVKIDGTGARQLTFGNDNTTSPEWFPDGTKIAFLSSRAAATPRPPQESGRARRAGAAPRSRGQVFFMYTDGGEAWPATKHETAITSFSISPDGKKLLLTAQDPLTPRIAAASASATTPRSWTRRSAGRTSGCSTSSPARRNALTTGKFVVSDPQWAPDSTSTRGT